MLLEKVAANTRGRDFVVSDLHGHYDDLMAALAGVDFDKKEDRVFAVGDLIDRGPDSFKCLQLVYEPWFKSVLGNHETMMRNALYSTDSNEPIHNWLRNGGYWCYQEDRAELFQIATDALNRMPYAIELSVGGRRLGIVHAEPPGLSWGALETAQVWGDAQLIDEITTRITWSRGRIKHEDRRRVQGIDAVVCGHTIVDDPWQLGNVHYIDTGVFTENGRLTLIEATRLIDQAVGEELD